jgi:pilus assembly protein CpaF
LALDLEKEIPVIRKSIKDQLDLLPLLSDEQLLERIERAVFDISHKHYVPALEKREVVHRLYNSFRGFDILQPLIDDKTITEIMVNNYDEIFIEREGAVIAATEKFESQEKLEDIIQSVVAGVNRAVNESSPIVDARLKDGSRVSVVLPPITLKGPTMTIRKFPEQPLTMDDLVNKGALTIETRNFLQAMVRAKYNIFISGGTGSGKTTFLNALANYIPAEERVITIEDSAELQLCGIPNLVRMETRNANTEGRGHISIKDLIRTSLRMRPNRIIVGEVRGAEALDMLQAMNTGHDGSISTGHANSVEDIVGRLETMVLSAANLPVEVIRKQISSAIDILIHLSRLRDRTRKVVEIAEVIGFKDGEVQLNRLYTFLEEGENDAGMILGSLKSTGNGLGKIAKLKMAGIQL